MAEYYDMVMSVCDTCYMEICVIYNTSSFQWIVKNVLFQMFLRCAPLIVEKFHEFL